jgi:hypothetical protein
MFALLLPQVAMCQTVAKKGSIHLSGSAAGIYLLRAVMGNGHTQTFKFAKP